MPATSDRTRHDSPVVPTIDIAQGRTLEPSAIPGLLDPSDPVELIQMYEQQGAGRVFVDVQEPWERSAASLAVVGRARDSGVDLWVSVANGVARSFDDIGSLFALGVDAVGISTTSVERPSILHTAAERFGGDRVLGVMNVRRSGEDHWDVAIEGGETDTPLDAVMWARMLTDLGASRILPNSLDQEGTGKGYDLALVRAMAEAVPVPVVASGGCGTLPHLLEGMRAGATYVITQKMLHDGSHSVGEADRYIRESRPGN